MNFASLLAAHGADVGITFEFEATSADGFDDAKVRTVSENATTPKLDQYRSEEH